MRVWHRRLPVRESENGSWAPPPHDVVNGSAYIASMLGEGARNQPS